ncbi:glycosyltransferase family 4 protein [Roseibacillus persicicus]|uniref:glycosyltransferase family 4 protein n=1 Tax=Roseibacillus persicicus TaxID=454148 RepID=UPI00280CD0F2|nr:glycosyltransferase family 4 protein [Roseibacillus persicicus]MDQ8190599.1 glycosyltransferase family 4 protein [Roseibacillus persicicus]
MKILFISYAFYPSVGGIESSAILFLSEFRELGCEIRLITNSELGGDEELKWPQIYRCPSFREQLHLGKWADVVYHHNPSFSYGLTTFLGRPTVISIRTWVSRTDGLLTFKDHIKQIILSRFPCIANSRATAQSLRGKALVIENAYDDEVFRETSSWSERSGAAFVGRLVSDKGIATAVEALALLKERGIVISFQVMGAGPEEVELRNQVEAAGLCDQVHFLGRCQPEELAATLNRVKYLLVPSRWPEPFGIVALEGIGCGCIPIGTNQGGLVDAIGPCGPLFERDDAEGLADCLADLEQDETRAESYRKEREKHLDAHSPGVVAERYLDVFRESLKQSKK